MAKTEDKCTSLWNLLKEKAPVLRPKVIGRGLDDDQLQALCLTETQKADLDATLDKHINSKNGKICSACSQLIGEAGGYFVSDWDFDFDAKLQKFTQLSYLCELCYSLSDLEEFLPMASAPNAAIMDHIAKFHLVNGISITEYSPVMLVDYLQQCYSVAYSLKVLLSNFPKMTLVDNHKRPFTEITDFKALVKGSLPRPAMNHEEPQKVESEGKSSSSPKPNSHKSTPKSTPKSNLFTIDTTPRKSPAQKTKSRQETEELENMARSPSSASKKRKLDKK